MTCDIIIPVWDQLEATRACLEHLVRNTGFPYRLIIIDNASRADTKKYLESFAAGRPPDVKLIRNEENVGFVKAVNQGFGVSDSPYVCLMNNDTVPAPKWLENMVEFADSHGEIGLVNPLCNGHGERSIDEYARILDNNKGKYMETNQCFGFCMLIKREVIDKIGILDERFGIGGFDDTDYSMRAYRSGYRCAVVYSAYVYHKEHTSFDAMGDRKLLVSKCEEEYFKKWPRHLRVGIGLTLNSSKTDDEIEEALKAVLFLAREWCWVNLWIFGNEKESRGRVGRLSKNIDMPLHQNIKFNYLSDAFMGVQLLTRLIERSFGSKKRKRYDFFLVADNSVGRIIKRFYPIHRTAVYPVELNKDLIDFIKTKINLYAVRCTQNAERII